jgi:hypothetical protein
MTIWHVSEALTTVRRLQEVLPQLTDEELTKVIGLEEAALRRKTFLNRLYREARVRARKKFIR